MVELIVIIVTILLSIFLLKRWSKTGTSSSEKENVSEAYNSNEIIGKSTFVLTAGKRDIPQSSSPGKMDIEVPLEYEPDISFIEEQEELEQLGLSTEFSSDITFEEMMEVVNEVENVQPQNPSKTAKLLYENDNTDWVDQMASISPDYQKRIVKLIDLHLGKLTKNEIKQVIDDEFGRFDIREYVG
ncbi:MAG: hypothetical protein JXR82_01015 [Marinifilaceae bacterium]|nr:hypothetical protein [Marinifilaceae bacterium]